VESGYWPLYRFNPDLAKEGQNPFLLESKAPDGTLQEFLAGENRYAALAKLDSEASKKLRAELEKSCNERYRHYKALAELPGPGAQK